MGGVRVHHRDSLGVVVGEGKREVAGSRSRQTAVKRPPDAAFMANQRSVPDAPAALGGNLFAAPSSICCSKCETALVPSMRQYEKFKENGISLPDACPKCKGQVCDLFRDNGVCSFGENCKFLQFRWYQMY